MEDKEWPPPSLSQPTPQPLDLQARRIAIFRRYRNRQIFLAIMLLMVITGALICVLHRQYQALVFGGAVVTVNAFQLWNLQRQQQVELNSLTEEFST